MPTCIRRRLAGLERSLLLVLLLASAGAGGCDAFADPSAGGGGEQDFPPFGGPGQSAGMSFAGSAGAFGPGTFVPTPVGMPPSLPPGCPRELPALGSACTHVQLCTYQHADAATGCPLLRSANCAAGVWTVSSTPLGACPGEPDDDAGVDEAEVDDDDAGV
jgi:hypothetical protein